jgi:hypothetical protein
MDAYHLGFCAGSSRAVFHGCAPYIRDGSDGTCANNPDGVRASAPVLPLDWLGNRDLASVSPVASAGAVPADILITNP